MEFLYYFLVLGFWFNCRCEGVIKLHEKQISDTKPRGDLDYDGKLNIKLDHELENAQTPSYFHRGDIFIKSLSSGVAVLEEFNLTNEQIRLLKDLVKKGGNYKLRATAKTSDGKENYYYTFVKASSLVESHLTNIISINLDHNGNIIAVSMVVPNKHIGIETKNGFLGSFNTTVEIRHMELGPVPDTATYIQKLEREREAKELGDSKDNRSFLAKYWMYIVTVLIFMLLLSAVNPESAGAAQR